MDKILLEEIERHNALSDAGKTNNIYSPIYVNEELYFEFRNRPFQSQIEKRISLFPIDFHQESILDVGTNSGFIALYLKKYHNAGNVLGVDITGSFRKIWNRITQLEQIRDLNFDVVSEEWIPEEKYDNILILSISNKEKTYYKSLSYLIEKLKPYVNKSIYVEPTNHKDQKLNRSLTKDEIRDIYTEYLSQWGRVKLLGHTDYQDRGLFRIDV